MRRQLRWTSLQVKKANFSLFIGVNFPSTPRGFSSEQEEEDLTDKWLSNKSFTTLQENWQDSAVPFCPVVPHPPLASSNFIAGSRTCLLPGLGPKLITESSSCVVVSQTGGRKFNETSQQARILLQGARNNLPKKMKSTTTTCVAWRSNVLSWGSRQQTPTAMFELMNSSALCDNGREEHAPHSHGTWEGWPASEVLTWNEEKEKILLETWRKKKINKFAGNPASPRRFPRGKILKINAELALAETAADHASSWLSVVGAFCLFYAPTAHFDSVRSFLRARQRRLSVCGSITLWAQSSFQCGWWTWALSKYTCM